VLPITFGFAAASCSVNFASTSRCHGHRPMLAIEVSSMAMTTMSGSGDRFEACTPRS
jgi:hypothetical protein